MSNDSKEKVAIVLCGGGALGAYQMGVWKYLNEIDFHYDIVTGTSIGAINGSLMVSHNYDLAVKLWDNIAYNKVIKTEGIKFDKNFHFSNTLFKYAPHISRFIHQYIRQKGVDNTPFKRLCRENISPRRIKQSPVKFGLVTTLFPSMKEVDIKVQELPEEDILPFIHASSACYPVFPVEKIKGRKYVDGGFKNNLPIDFAIELGATKVVAVLLDSFPKAQFSELEYLPGVTRIAPTWTIGNMADLRPETIKNNQILGYNDALKAFKVKEGFRYTFNKFKDNDYVMAKSFFFHLLRHATRHFNEIDAILRWRSHEPTLSEMDYFVRALEIFAEIENIDYLKIYDLDELINICWDKIVTFKHDEKIMKSYLKIEEGKLGKKTDPRAFIYYVRSRLEKGIDLAPLWEKVGNYPALAIILSFIQTLFRYFDPLKRLD